MATSSAREVPLSSYDARAITGGAHARSGPSAFDESLLAPVVKVKRDLLRMIGHELRTPLNAIAGYVELLDLEVYGPVTPEQHEALTRVSGAQRHLLGLVNDVMNLARLESGQICYDTAPVALSSIVPDLELMIAPQLHARALTFLVSDCSDCVVLADQRKLLQVLLNLLSNAVKFTPEGGEIRLDCPTRGGSGPRVPTAFIRVSDTGIGIPLEKQRSVFEPFVQVDTTPAGRAAGFGLGLAISRDMARGMNGDLRVRSVPGRGSAFTLSLPTALHDAD